MRLRLTRTAASQLDRLLTEIAQHRPSGAHNVQACIRASMRLLLQYPHAGQATERPFVRRLVVSPYPYVLTHRVTDDEIVIRTVRHTGRRPLP